MEPGSPRLWSSVEGCGNVTVVQPRVDKVCWCCGTTKGKGSGISGARVSCSFLAVIAFPDNLRLLLVFERNREMIFEMEKCCSNGFEGSVVAMLLPKFHTNTAMISSNVIGWLIQDTQSWRPGIKECSRGEKTDKDEANDAPNLELSHKHSLTGRASSAGKAFSSQPWKVDRCRTSRLT